MAENTTTAESKKRLSPNKKIAVAGGAATLGVALIGTLLSGGITGANWSDKESPGEAVYLADGQIQLNRISDVSYMDNFTAGAEQATETNTFSPYPGAELRRVWSGTVTAAKAGKATLSFQGATFDLQDVNGESVAGENWDARFGTDVKVSLDGIVYYDEDFDTPGIQFILPSDVTDAPLIITIDGTFPADAGNSTAGRFVKINAGDIDLYQSGFQEAVTFAQVSIDSLPQSGATVPAGQEILVAGAAEPGSTLELMFNRISDTPGPGQRHQEVIVADENGQWSFVVPAEVVVAGHEYTLSASYSWMAHPDASGLGVNLTVAVQ